MDWFRALDTFSADLANGTQARVVRGDPYPGNHELVKLDLEWAAKAAKAGVERAPLFKKLDTGEEEPAMKPRAARVAAKVTGKS